MPGIEKKLIRASVLGFHPAEMWALAVQIFTEVNYYIPAPAPIFTWLKGNTRTVPDIIVKNLRL